MDYCLRNQRGHKDCSAYMCHVADTLHQKSRSTGRSFDCVTEFRVYKRLAIIDKTPALPRTLLRRQHSLIDWPKVPLCEPTHLIRGGTTSSRLCKLPFHHNSKFSASRCLSSTLFSFNSRLMPRLMRWKRWVHKGRMYRIQHWISNRPTLAWLTWKTRVSTQRHKRLTSSPCLEGRTTQPRDSK